MCLAAIAVDLSEVTTPATPAAAAAKDVSFGVILLLLWLGISAERKVHIQLVHIQLGHKNSCTRNFLCVVRLCTHVIPLVPLVLC